MANEDLKLYNILGMSATANTAGSSTSGAAITNSTNIENIFKAFEELAKRRGITITPERFIDVVNCNPKIFNLPVEQQAGAIVQLLESKMDVADTNESQGSTSQNNEVPTSPFLISIEDQERLLAAISASEQNPVEDSNSVLDIFDIDEQNIKEETEDISTFNTIKQNYDIDVEPKDGMFYDTVAFNKLPHEDKIKEYKKEFARNMFLYGDNQSRPSKDWDNLTKEEQAKLIEKYSSSIDKELDDIYKEVNNSTLKLLGQKMEGQYSILDHKMLALQTANYYQTTIEKLTAINGVKIENADIWVCAYEAEMLSDKRESDLSPTEKTILKAATFIKESMEDYVKNHYNKEIDIPFSDLPNYIKQQTLLLSSELEDRILQDVDYSSEYKNASDEEKIKIKAEFCSKYNLKEVTEIPKSGNRDSIPIGLAIKEKLQSMKESGVKLSETENKMLAFLEEVDAELLETFGFRYGDSTALTKELLNDPEFAERYNKASNIEKIKIKREYVQKKYANDPDKYLKFLQDALECADIDEIHGLFDVIKNSEGLQKGVIELLNLDNVTAVVLPSHVLGKSLIKLLNKLKNAMNDPKYKYSPNIINRYKRIGAHTVTTADDSQLKEKENIDAWNSMPGATNADGIINKAIRNRIYDINKDGESASTAAKGFLVGWQQDAKDAFGVNIDKANENIQADLFDVAAHDNNKTASAMNRAGTMTRLAVKNQQSAFNSLQDVFENNMPVEQGKKELCVLADQIPKCHVSNQSTMHQSLTNGKYEEVAVYAAANIYKYDKSVQAEALSISYATGNVAIIEAANLQVVYMNEAAVVAMKEQISAQIQAMEERHTAALVDEFATRQVKKELGFDVDTNKPEYKTRMEAYIAELKSLPKSELYKKIINDMQSWPATMQAMFLEAIVKYCPQLFAMMLDTFGAKLLFAFGQVNSATKNEILMQMLKTPTKRSEAIAYIKSNPNGNYSDKLKKLYDEVIDDLIASGQIVEDSAPKELLTGKSREEIDYTQGASTIEAIGRNYNLDTKTDIYGNTWLIS